MKNDFLTFIFHFFKKCKMICLRNEVIFIFQNRQKINNPKTHALTQPIFDFFETVPSTLSSIWYPRQLAQIAGIIKSCRFCVR